MHRSKMRPFPAGPTFMMEVMVLGAFGAHACQAVKMRAACACDSVQDTPNTTATLSGNTLSLNCVAMPKLPPPPPRHAQYRSGLDVALACSVRAWASMIVAC